MEAVRVGTTVRGHLQRYLRCYELRRLNDQEKWAFLAEGPFFCELKRFGLVTVISMVAAVAAMVTVITVVAAIALVATAMIATVTAMIATVIVSTTVIFVAAAHVIAAELMTMAVAAEAIMISTTRKFTTVSIAGIIVVIDVTVPIAGTAEPWACSDEEAVRVPFRAVVAIGSAIVRGKIEIAIGTDGLRPHVQTKAERDLSFCG